MEVRKLLAQEVHGKGGFTHEIKLTYADLTETATNTAQTIELLDVAVGDTVLDAAYFLTEEFEDASDNALNTTTLIVGDGGDTDRFIPSKEINLNGSEVDQFATSNATTSLPYAYLAADTIDATFGSMTAKALNDLDVGEIHIFLKIAKLGSA